MSKDRGESMSATVVGKLMRAGPALEPRVVCPNAQRA
jgi:hypothetical protein